MSLPPNGDNSGLPPEQGPARNSQSPQNPFESQPAAAQQPNPAAENQAGTYYQTGVPGQPYPMPPKPKTLPLIGSAKVLLSDLLAVGVTYGGVLVTSIIIGLLVTLAGGMSALQSLEDVGGSLDDFSYFTNGIDINPIVFVGLVFQVAAMALGGVFTLKVKETVSSTFLSGSSSSGTEIAVHLKGLPLFATLAGILLLYFVSRKITQREIKRGTPVTVGGLWLRSALTGLTLAVFALLITLITAPRMGVDVFGTEAARLTMSSVSAGLFFWPLLFGTLVSAAGRRSALKTPTAFTDKLHLLLPGLKTASAITLVIMAGFTVLLGIALFIYLIVENGFSSAFAFMVALPGAAIVATGLSYLTGIRYYADSFYYSDDRSVFTDYLWDVTGYWSILIILLAVLVIVLIAFAWAGRRPRINTIGSWFVMPLAFIGLGFVFNLLTIFSATASYEGNKESVGIHLAGWTFLVMLIWGVIVEVLARFAVPYLAGVLPLGLRQKLMGQPVDPQVTPAFAAPTAAPASGAPGAAAGAAPAAAETPAANQAPAAPADSDPTLPLATAATAVGAAGAATAGATYVASQPGAVAGGEPKPMSESAKKKVKIGVFSFLGLVALVLIGVATVAILNATTFNPKNAVSSYMQSVQDGDVDGAVSAIDPNVPSDQRALLNSDILNSADKRVTGFEVDDVEKSSDGKSAIATVKVTQDQKTSELTLNLKRTGGMLGVNQWEIDSDQQGLYRTVSVYIPKGTTELTVNGTTVNIDESGSQPSASASSSSYYDYSENPNAQLRTFTVLPGEYTFKAPDGTKYITYGSDQKTYVNLESDASNVEFTQKLTDAVLTDAQAAAKTKLDECAAVKEFEVEDCGLEYSTYGDRYRNPSWSIEKYPEYKLSNSSYASSSSDSSDVDPSRTIYLANSKTGEAKLTYQYKGFDDEWDDEDYEKTIYTSFVVEISGDELTLVNSDSY